MKYVIYSLVACIILLLPGIGSAMTCSVYCPDGSSVSQDCDSNNDPCVSSVSSGDSGNSGYDYGAAQRAQEAAAAAAAAAAERQHQLDEAARIERERRAEEKRQKEAAFIRGRDSAVHSFKGSSDSAMSQLKDLSGTGTSGLKGSSFDTGVQLKSAPPSSSGDPMVVDARKVSSGLPKAVDKAIVAAYSDAPPGVSDRVRKGFQAVAEHDWKVAKAWFQDAFNRDPSNAGLKRLVELVDPPKQTSPAPGNDLQLPDPNDIYIFFPRPEDQTVRAAGTKLQLPEPDDILLLFPGEYLTTPDAGTKLQLPDPNDIYLMFPNLEEMDNNEMMDILFGLDKNATTLKSKKRK